jgi:hypothetical protein
VNRRVSDTVRCGYRMSSWATKPVRRFMVPEKGCPLYVIFPDSLPLRRPPRAVRRVVLPLPDGPSIARISPGQTIPVIPFSMVFSWLLQVPPQHNPFWSSLTLYTTSSNWKETDKINKFVIGMKNAIWLLSQITVHYSF